jgi:hypothetical protein
MIVITINNGTYKILYEAAMAKSGGSGIPFIKNIKITMWQKSMPGAGICLSWILVISTN